MKRTLFSLALGVATIANFAGAKDTKILVEKAVIRNPPPSPDMTAGYATITSSIDQELTGIDCAEFAKSAELHETINKKGTMAMVSLDKVELKANKAVELSPGGKHIMLMELKKIDPKLKSTECTLLLSKSGPFKTKFEFQ